MLKFYAAPFMATMNDLGRAIRALDDAMGKSDPPNIRVASALRYLARDLPYLPLSSGVRSQFARLQERVAEGKASVEAIRTLLYEFEASLNDDLKQHSYFLIPASQRALFEQPDLFGADIGARLPKAKDDIAAAGRCMALNEWTAAVFHLMRASEHALRVLAKRLRIKDVDIKEWARALQDIDNALKAMGQTPRTAKRDRKIQYFSEARADLASFNNAWRKHVMHSRETYSEAQARPIFHAVKSFMQRLAQNAPR